MEWCQNTITLWGGDSAALADKYPGDEQLLERLISLGGRAGPGVARRAWGCSGVRGVQLEALVEMVYTLESAQDVPVTSVQAWARQEPNLVIHHRWADLNTLEVGSHWYADGSAVEEISVERRWEEVAWWDDTRMRYETVWPPDMVFSAQMAELLSPEGQ